MKKKTKDSSKQKLVNLLRKRLKLLGAEKQHYEQNPVLANNVRMANIELIQGDIASLEKMLSGSRGIKDRDFKDLLTSIAQPRKIHSGKIKAGRISKFHP